MSYWKVVDVFYLDGGEFECWKDKMDPSPNNNMRCWSWNALGDAFDSIIFVVERRVFINGRLIGVRRVSNGKGPAVL
jgi:hypothetical protein